MRNILVLTTIVLSACSTAAPQPSGGRDEIPTQTASPTQTEVRAQTPTPPPEQPAPRAAPAAAEITLNDLNAMTFSCTKAGLNAAAREAAKSPAKGTYHFSYFRLVSSSHHSTYEVHFKSNNYEDEELRYCVSVYCQQGWDPKTANLSVRLMGRAARPAGAKVPAAEHGADCSEHVPRATRRARR